MSSKYLREAIASLLILNKWQHYKMPISITNHRLLSNKITQTITLFSHSQWLKLLMFITNLSSIWPKTKTAISTANIIKEQTRSFPSITVRKRGSRGPSGTINMTHSKNSLIWKIKMTKQLLLSPDKRLKICWKYPLTKSASLVEVQERIVMKVTILTVPPRLVTTITRNHRHKLIKDHRN